MRYTPRKLIAIDAAFTVLIDSNIPNPYKGKEKVNRSKLAWNHANTIIAKSLKYSINYN